MTVAKFYAANWNRTMLGDNFGDAAKASPKIMQSARHVVQCLTVLYENLLSIKQQKMVLIMFFCFKMKALLLNKSANLNKKECVFFSQKAIKFIRHPRVRQLSERACRFCLMTVYFCLFMVFKNRPVFVSFSSLSPVPVCTLLT